jgi:integral membrane sensor domain MASE1/anti-sigma regulatory factor (Ser/Thr protein kinase)
MVRGERWRSFTLPTRLVVVAVAYYASARLGLRLALVGHIVTPLWPPTGVAVVAVAAYGFSVWPAIALAAFAVNVSIADTPLVAAGIAAGNTLAPLAAVALLRRFSFDRQLARLRDAMTLVAVALASMLISASVGTACVELAGSSARVIDTWWVWWAGDAMGVLIVAPFLWSLARLRGTRIRWTSGMQGVALFAALIVASIYGSRAEDGLLFIVLPFVGWIAWRFQQRGAGPAALVASSIVILAAAHDRGVFRGEALLHKMVLLQAFNACVALTSLVFAAAVTERRHFLERLYEREHRIAEMLQRSLLPAELPAPPGVDVAARYLPSSSESQLGGDWYDVIELGGDKLGLAVGDVVGHGISAAAAMAQLRVGLRAYALARRGPSATVRDVNRMAIDLHPGTMATLLYAEFDVGSRELRVADAGHPAPLLVPNDGDPFYLEVGHAAPIGVTADLHCQESVHTLPEGSTLLLFTDGLVERRNWTLDGGLERLRRASAVNGQDLDGLCDRILNRLDVGQAMDDVALLALRATSLAGLDLRLQRPATPVAVAEVRHVLRRWLRANGATEDEAFEILVACSEAQTNAVRHAYRGPEGVVDIEASTAASSVTITIRDHGTRRERSTSIDDHGGRGLPLMRELADVEVTVDQRGTEVTIRREVSGIPSKP